MMTPLPLDIIASYFSLITRECIEFTELQLNGFYFGIIKNENNSVEDCSLSFITIEVCKLPYEAITQHVIPRTSNLTSISIDLKHGFYLERDNI
jgi:hypothetical protein